MPPEIETPKLPPEAPPPTSNDMSIEGLKAEVIRLQQALKEKHQGDTSNEGASLNTRVNQERIIREAKETETKQLQDALTFILKSEDFLKSHTSILPASMAEIFKVADKEKFDSPVQKANAIKSGMIQEFFQIQANVELLTSAHKSAIEDYLKLTKNGKEERANSVYENIFEPSLELVKRTKKAEELTRARNGYGTASDFETNYKNKLQALSAKKYLGAKG